MTVGGVGPFPLAGNQRAQGFKAQPTGYAYVGGPLTRDFALGLSVTVPFGLKNNYDSDAFSRYDSLKTKLTVIDIAPSAAFRVSDILSLGGSIIVERADATLTNALPNPLDPSGPNPASDGLLSLSADNWKVGFLVGVHVRPVEGLDIGLTYRNRMTHHLSGDADTAFAGTAATQGAKSRLALPEVYSLGLSYQLTDRVKLLAGAQYFGWDRFKEISVDLADGTTVATTVETRADAHPSSNVFGLGLRATF
jgi:long-chain fatty acid transport protein